MGKMKEISLYCEDEDLQGLTEYLERNTEFKDDAMGIAANFIVAHKRMRDKSEEEAYRVLNEIHDKYQEGYKKKVKPKRQSMISCIGYRGEE